MIVKVESTSENPNHGGSAMQIEIVGGSTRPLSWYQALTCFFFCFLVFFVPLSH